MKMRYILPFLSVLCGCCLQHLHAASDPFTDWSNRVTRSLETRVAEKTPLLTLQYKFDYRFLFLRLFHVGQATVEIAEGLWQYDPKQEYTPVYLVDVRLTSGHDDFEDENFVHMDDRLITAVDKSDMRTVFYAKKIDEYVRVFFTKTRMRKTCSYALLHDSIPEFFAYDAVKQELQDEPPEAKDFLSRGQDVEPVLDYLDARVAASPPEGTAEKSPRLELNIGGVLYPFTLTVKPVELHAMGREWKAVQCRAMPKATLPEKSKLEHLVAAVINVERYIEAEKRVDILPWKHPWHLLPLQADYDLMLGFVRAKLVAVTLP